MKIFLKKDHFLRQIVIYIWWQFIFIHLNKAWGICLRSPVKESNIWHMSSLRTYLKDFYGYFYYQVYYLCVVVLLWWKVRLHLLNFYLQTSDSFSKTTIKQDHNKKAGVITGNNKFTFGRLCSETRKLGDLDYCTDFLDFLDYAID